MYAEGPECRHKWRASRPLHKVSGAHDQACCPSIQGLASGIDRSWQHLPQVGALAKQTILADPRPLLFKGSCLGGFGAADPPFLALTIPGPEIRSQRDPPDPPRIHPAKNQKTPCKASTPGLGYRLYKGPVLARGELLQVPGLSWVLQYPWLWEGRRATWIDLRHRC